MPNLTPTYLTSKRNALKFLEFDAESHRYTAGAFLVPGVTSIIAPQTAIGRLPKEQLEAARIRGTEVHELTETWDNGPDDQDGTSLIAEEMGWGGYLDAWRKFLADKKPEIHAVELMVYHTRLRYAGTLDRLLTIDGRLAILDIKTGDAEKSYRMQTAAYLEAYNEDLIRGEPATARYALHLKPNGKYVLQEHKNKTDFAAFVAALTLYNWEAAE